MPRADTKQGLSRAIAPKFLYCLRYHLFCNGNAEKVSIHLYVQVSDVITTGYKWLRAVCQGEYTGVHTDKVFLARGSSRVLTAWVPLSKVTHLAF